MSPDLDEPSETTAIVPVEDVGAEATLNEKIPALWLAHRESKVAAKRSNQELAAVRRELAAHLFAMKSLLVRTGRSGLWSSFLRKHNIPRTSGDRIASSHESTLKNGSMNCANGAVPEPMEAQVHRLIQKIHPQIAKVVTSNEAAFAFVCEVLSRLPDADFYIGSDFVEVYRPNEQAVAHPKST